MSSHHIVREKQEPALIILDLNNFDYELLGQLLEWSPTVLATQNVAEQLITNDIHIDWLLTPATENTNVQATTQVILSPEEGWLKDSLRFLVDKGYPAVNIIADEFNPDTYMPFINQINIVVYHHKQKIYFVKSGFEKWFAAGSILSIIQPIVGLSYKNLDQTKGNQYKVQQDGFVTLYSESMMLIIAENI